MVTRETKQFMCRAKDWYRISFAPILFEKYLAFCKTMEAFGEKSRIRVSDTQHCKLSWQKPIPLTHMRPHGTTSGPQYLNST
jgi:hypothetical protein